VLVRWLVADDEAQVRRVHKLFRSPAETDAQLLVPCTVTFAAAGSVPMPTVDERAAQLAQAGLVKA
jgi:hypothetical protein